jgi:hypothetical protein
MMLTTRHIILIDNTYIRFEPQMIPLLDILSVTAGKVATGEPVITLALTGTSGTGDSQVTNLIFSQQPGEQRKQERDTWLRKLMGDIVSARQQTIRTDILPADQDNGIRPTGATPRPIEMAFPRQTIDKTYPEPAEIVILPDQLDFPVASEEEPRSNDTLTPPAAAVEKPLVVPEEELESPESTTPMAPVIERPPAADKEEPGSVQKIIPAGPGGEELSVAFEGTTGSSDQFTNTVMAVQASMMTHTEKTGSLETAPSGSPVVEESREQPAAEAPPYAQNSPFPLPAPRSGWYTVIVMTAIIILAMAMGAFLFSQYAPQNNGKAHAPVVIPIPPTIRQTIPTPLPVMIPQNGVWVRVAYGGTFIGWVGNPGSLQHVAGSGDRFYKVPDSAGLVQVSFQKQDNSGKTLALEIYRNGEMIYSRTIRTPMGTIEILLDPETGNPPGIIPAVSQTANKTSLSTGRIFYF